MKIYSYIYSLRGLQNNEERTMISYAEYKTKPSILEYSTSFSTLLGDSITHSKLLLA